MGGIIGRERTTRKQPGIGRDRREDGDRAMLHEMTNRLRERSGIYGLGFKQASVVGLLLPIAFVILIGGLGALLIWLN